MLIWVENQIRREMAPVRLVPAHVIVYLLASNPEEGLRGELSLPPRCLTSAMTLDTKRHVVLNIIVRDTRQ